MKRSVLTLAMTTATALLSHAGIIGFEDYTFTGSELTETNRINRDGVISDWGSAKTFPGTIAGSFDYTTFSFNSGLLPELQITITSTSGINVFESLYTTFDPTDITTGYLGDAGSSNGFQSFRIDGALNTDYTIVINAIDNTTIAGAVVNVCAEGFASASSPAPTPACANLNQSLFPTPEPASGATTLVALPVMFWAYRRFRRSR
jgi:hypothetical protein